MKIGAIVQVRMDSKRFPGKILFKVRGKPLLQYLIERLNCCRNLDNIIIATSKEDSDTPLSEYCKHNSIFFYRGSLSDVAGRFKQVLDEYKFDAFVRVNGDSPLIDQRLIEKGLNIFLDSKYDLVTNILKRTYPKGQSVEILRADTFRNAYKKMKNIEDLEHVTKYFYKNQNNFEIFNFESGKELGKIQLSVDTPEDMDMFSKIIDKMDKPHWEYTLENILRIYSNLRG
jgi:spore coat polysaccharide biosynthesis protein SpsF (cytidylyltransferase family)